MYADHYVTSDMSTRNGIKKMHKKGTLDGGQIGPVAGNTNHNNDEEEQATHATSTATMSTMISKELSNANLSGEMLSLANIIYIVIQTQFDLYLTKLNSKNILKKINNMLA